MEVLLGNIGRIWRVFQSRIAAFLLLFLTFSGGCGHKPSSPEEISAFNRAGPIQAWVDFEKLSSGRPGPYRVIPGDVLGFDMEVDLRVVSGELAEWIQPGVGRREMEPYLVRVSDEGMVTLPIIGSIEVAGKTLAEIEAAVKSTYYPKYVVNPPMLICQVVEYEAKHERVFTVMGLVNRPDAYEYPPDVQYNLMEALAYAGGLDMVADPRYVKVFRQDADGEVKQATIPITDKQLASAYNVPIKPGDVVYVDHTFRTRMNKFLSDVFHISVGAHVRSSEY